MELCESFAQFAVEPLGIVAVLEPHEEIVGVPHDDDITARDLRSPLLGPEVEDVVQLDVGEQR